MVAGSAFAPLVSLPLIGGCGLLTCTEMGGTADGLGLILGGVLVVVFGLIGWWRRIWWVAAVDAVALAYIYYGITTRLESDNSFVSLVVHPSWGFALGFIGCGVSAVGAHLGLTEDINAGRDEGVFGASKAAMTSLFNEDGSGATGSTGSVLGSADPAVLMPDGVTRPVTRACPECGEDILVVARKCKHCGSAVTPQPAETAVPAAIATTTQPQRSFCGECGAGMSASDTFCGRCGTRQQKPVKD